MLLDQTLNLYLLKVCTIIDTKTIDKNFFPEIGGENDFCICLAGTHASLPQQDCGEGSGGGDNNGSSSMIPLP